MAPDSSSYRISSEIHTPSPVPPSPLWDDQAEVTRLLELTRDTIQDATSED